MSVKQNGPVRLVQLGRVLKPHGLKGELCVEVYADSPFIFEGLKRIYLQFPGKNARACVLSAWRPHQDRALIFVDRCLGRDQAEAWRGAEVWARARDLPGLDDGPIPEDVLGLPVFLVSGEEVGIVGDIQDVAGQELWFIYDAQENEILIPGVDDIIVNIDWEQKRILINPPPGLLELYQQK